LGFAALDLVALQLPGKYEITVFVWKGGHYGETTVPITVRRR